MTENANEAILYAIRLPNGELARNLTHDERHGGAYEELPGGEYAYLWADEKLAADTLDNVRAAVKRFGLSDMFTQHAEVVKVRLSYQILDEAIAEAEVAGVTEPHTWDSVTEIPVGTRFRYAWTGATYERRESDCLHLRSAAMYQFDAFPDRHQGFIEVPREKREPRTWEKAEDVPDDVQIRAIGWPSVSPTFVRNGSRWTPVDRSPISEIESDALLNAVWSPTGTGFVEVLS
jgi:hypothetical protein